MMAAPVAGGKAGRVRDAADEPAGGAAECRRRPDLDPERDLRDDAERRTGGGDSLHQSGDGPAQAPQRSAGGAGRGDARRRRRLQSRRMPIARWSSAFMAGLNRTAKLKFDASRAGDHGDARRRTARHPERHRHHRRACDRHPCRGTTRQRDLHRRPCRTARVLSGHAETARRAVAERADRAARGGRAVLSRDGRVRSRRTPRPAGPISNFSARGSSS